MQTKYTPSPSSLYLASTAHTCVFDTENLTDGSPIQYHRLSYIPHLPQPWVSILQCVLGPAVELLIKWLPLPTGFQLVVALFCSRLFKWIMQPMQQFVPFRKIKYQNTFLFNLLGQENFLYHCFLRCECATQASFCEGLGAGAPSFLLCLFSFLLSPLSSFPFHLFYLLSGVIYSPTIMWGHSKESKGEKLENVKHSIYI